MESLIKFNPERLHQVPRGDGGANDYEWVAPEQCMYTAKAILRDLAASGYAASSCEVGTAGQRH